MLSLINIYKTNTHVIPTQIFNHNSIPPHRGIHYFDFCDNNFFAFLYSFTTGIHIPKQCSLVCPLLNFILMELHSIQFLFLLIFLIIMYISIFHVAVSCLRVLIFLLCIPIYVYMNVYLFLLLLMDIILNIITLHSVLIAGEANPPMLLFKIICLFWENAIFQLI